LLSVARAVLIGSKKKGLAASGSRRPAGDTRAKPVSDPMWPGHANVGTIEVFASALASAENAKETSVLRELSSLLSTGRVYFLAWLAAIDSRRFNAVIRSIEPGFVTWRAIKRLLR
jgi:hypothetical protein